MKKTFEKIMRRWGLRNINGWFADKDYNLVLKHLSRPYSIQRDDEAILNIFRIIALKETNQDTWKIEYNYLCNQNFLDVFSDEEKNYLKAYLSFRLFGNIEFSVNHNSVNISQRLRNYFPLYFLTDESIA